MPMDRHCSRSRSRSREEKNPERSSIARSRYSNDDNHERKRHRSRSVDRPRKRRSLSPRDNSRRREKREHQQRYRDRSKEHRRDSEPRQRRHDSDRSGRNISKSRSPGRRKRDSPEPYKKSKAPLPSQLDAFKGENGELVKAEVVDKQKPNFGTTGRLAAASNTVQTGGGQSIVLKYHEPSEARKPPAREPWRIYVFKGDEIMDTIPLAEQSCWLVGREAAVADYLIEHPSCSKQHAVIQFRYIEKRNEYGDKTGKVRPYVIDLESANGTHVNDEQIPDGRYVELRDKDVIKFGHSSREYVLQLPPQG